MAEEAGQTAFILNIIEKYKVLGLDNKGSLVFAPGAKKLKEKELYKIINFEVEKISRDDSIELREFRIAALADKSLIPHLLKEILKEHNKAPEEQVSIDELLNGEIEIFWTTQKKGIEEFTGEVPSHLIPLLIYFPKVDKFLRGSLHGISTFLDNYGLKWKDFCDKDFRASFREVYAVWDPYWNEKRADSFHPDSGAPLLKVNLYRPPAWKKFDIEELKKKRRAEGKSVKPSVFWSIIITNVLRGFHSREYFLLWLKHSMLGRCETLMYVVGPRRIGKTQLLQLWISLLGRHNCHIGKKEDLQQFNAFIEMITGAGFEEVSIDSDPIMNTCKAAMNPNVVIERKFQDSKNIKNYASFMFVNNPEVQSKFLPQERRISYPNTGEKRLDLAIKEYLEKNKIDADHMTYFKSFFEELPKAEQSEEFLEELALFADWVINRKPKMEWQMDVPFRGNDYFECAERALPVWQKQFIEWMKEEATDQCPIPIDALDAVPPEASPYTSLIAKDWCLQRRIPIIREKRLRQYFDHKMLEEFLDRYLYLGTFRLGEVVQLKVHYEGLKEKYANKYGFLANPEVLNLMRDPNRKEFW